MPLVVHPTTDTSGMAIDRSNATTGDSGGSPSVETNGQGVAALQQFLTSHTITFNPTPTLATDTTITANGPRWVTGSTYYIYNTSSTAITLDWPTGTWHEWGEWVTHEQTTQLRQQQRRPVLTGNGPLSQAAREAETASRIEDERRQREYEALQAQREARNRAFEAICRAEDEAAQTARHTARQLLLRLLTAEQRTMLEQHGYFEVRGSRTGHVYQIRQGSHGNIFKMHEDGQQMTAKYCGQPEGVPTEDMMLAQKLQIECDEDGFLAKANMTPLFAEDQALYAPRARHIRVRQPAISNAA